MEYSEISLKEILIMLLKGWKWIIGSIFISVVIVAFFTILYVPRFYESDLSFSFNIPTISVENDVYTSGIITEYGVYSIQPESIKNYLSFLTSNEVIEKTISDLSLNLSVEEFKKNISYSYVATNDGFDVNTTVLFEDISKINQIHNDLLKNFQYFLSEYLDEIVIKDLTTNNEKLLLKYQKNEIEINSQLNVVQKFLEQFTNDNLDINDSNYLLKYNEIIKRQINLNIDRKIIEDKIIQIETNIINLEKISSSQNDNNIDILDNILDKSFKLSEPILQKSSLPINLIIGSVIGFLIGIFIIFFTTYWQNTYVKN